MLKEREKRQNKTSDFDVLFSRSKKQQNQMIIKKNEIFVFEFEILSFFLLHIRILDHMIQIYISLTSSKSTDLRSQFSSSSFFKNLISCFSRHRENSCRWNIEDDNSRLIWNLWNDNRRTRLEHVVFYQEWWYCMYMHARHNDRWLLYPFPAHSNLALFFNPINWTHTIDSQRSQRKECFFWKVTKTHWVD